ncbi:hypothetical protein ACFWIA_30210 [Streptomyces sp. NPDC127068]|uniref:hypothetical protein n=1 Tax=Streptomyces sp. NPDC127068 TaxID=3347127 RepID=UPI003655E7C9
MRTAKRLQAQVERIPLTLRVWSIGAAGTAYLLSGMAFPRYGDSPTVQWALLACWFVSLVAFILLANEVTNRFSPRARRRLFTLRTIGSISGYLGLTACAVLVLFVDRAAAMALFALVAFGNYFIAGGNGSHPIPLKHLHARITTRVAFRVIAIAAASIALILFCTSTRTAPDQQNANFTFVTGIFLTAGGASLKVHSRARKLCTQISHQADSLVLTLDTLASGTADQRESRVSSARAEWMQLNHTLGNRIETGLPLHSTSLLPIPNRHRLQGLVNMALADALLGADSVAQARAELRELADACAPRIDTTL